MEKAPFLVLAKRTREVVDESWEEKAFAEDAAGMLGGCVWPPRSYFCSFCKREFRSAQALGGHMNVHRRDRAKLKQFSTSLNNQRMLNPHLTDCCNDQEFSSYVPLTLKNKEFCLDFQNPNPHQKISALIATSSKLCPEKNPCFSSTTKEFQGKNNGFCLIRKQNGSTLVEEEDAPICYKRRRLAEEDEAEHQVSEVNGLKSCAIQELDLELRLGDRPKTCKK